MNEGLIVNYANSEDAIDVHNDDYMQQNQEGELNSKCATYEFSCKYFMSSAPKKSTCTNVNLVTPLSTPKEEMKPSTLKVTSFNLSSQ